MDLGLTGGLVIASSTAGTEIEIRLSTSNGAYELSVGCEYELGSVAAATASGTPPIAPGEIVTRSEVDDTGVLTICFSSGLELRGYPDRDVEAWQLEGPGNLLVVALPGGGYATFG